MVAALAGLVGVLASREPELTITFEADAVRWCSRHGDTRIAYADVEAVAFSRGRYVPTAFYISTRDRRRLQLDCRWLPWSQFDNMRWEFQARTGLEVTRMR